MKIELERHSLCVAYILPNLRDCASSVSGEKSKAALRLPSSLTGLVLSFQIRFEECVNDEGGVRLVPVVQVLVERRF